MFIFVIYDIIYKRKTVLGYSLLVKLNIYDKTMGLIHKITHNQLIVIATRIKEINWYTDIRILVLEQYVQTITTPASYLYICCFQFWLQLRALMVVNSMPVF